MMASKYAARLLTERVEKENVKTEVCLATGKAAHRRGKAAFRPACELEVIDERWETSSDGSLAGSEDSAGSSNSSSSGLMGFLSGVMARRAARTAGAK